MDHTVQPWNPSTTYLPGDLVTHKSSLYEKADDADQSEPDRIAGGWVYKAPISTRELTEYNAIATSFDTYEARKEQHQQEVAAAKASAEAKLQALGLTPEELAAIGL